MLIFCDQDLVIEHKSSWLWPSVMTSWIKGLSKGVTGESSTWERTGSGCCRGDILGWWLHEWSLAVTAADGWQNPSGQSVSSSLGELNTDRRRHLVYTYTYSDYFLQYCKGISDKDIAKLQNRVKINNLIKQMSASYKPSMLFRPLKWITHLPERSERLFCQWIFYSRKMWFPEDKLN